MPYVIILRITTQGNVFSSIIMTLETKGYYTTTIKFLFDNIFYYNLDLLFWSS